MSGLCDRSGCLQGANPTVSAELGLFGRVFLPPPGRPLNPLLLLMQPPVKKQQESTFSFPLFSKQMYFHGLFLLERLTANCKLF